MSKKRKCKCYDILTYDQISTPEYPHELQDRCGNSRKDTALKLAKKWSREESTLIEVIYTKYIIDDETTEIEYISEELIKTYYKGEEIV